MIRTEMDSMPTEMDEISRRIMQHEIEEAALKKETDQLSREHLKEIQKELAEMREQFKSMKARWENEKSAISKVQKLREELEQVNADIEKAERSYDLNKAAELKYGKLPALQNSWRRKKTGRRSGKGTTQLRDKVTEEELRAYYLPLDESRLRADGGRTAKAAEYGGHPASAVIGQDEALTSVRKQFSVRGAFRTATARSAPSCFLCRRVGKTELAKALRTLFYDETNIVPTI
jgi:ATP-dependent Clp protease ATP-binding subunit ClpB